MDDATVVPSLYLGLLILQAFACGGFSAFVAREKRRDAAGWFLLGLFFSIIALVAIAGAPERRHSENESSSPTGIAIRSEDRSDPDASSGTKTVLIVTVVIIVLAVLVWLRWR